MKIRMDFVTNSSSSSFVTFGIISPELKDFIQELADEGYCSNGLTDFDTIKGYEVGEDLDLRRQAINITRDIYQMHNAPGGLKVYGIEEGMFYPDDYKEKDQMKFLKPQYAIDAIEYFFSNLPKDKEEKLKELVKKAFSEKNVGCKVYTDYTDGFSGEVISKIDIMKQNGLIKSVEEMDFSNPELAYFEKKKIDPHEIEFKGKTVGMSVVAYLRQDAEENQYFGNSGTAFDVAEATIKQLGGKVTKSVSSMTDYVVISKEMRKSSYLNDNVSSFYDSYCETQQYYKNAMVDGDIKRAKKNKLEIRVIFEDDFYKWLKEKYNKLKNSSDMFRPYGVIRIQVSPLDRIQVSNTFEFKSDYFANISEKQMKSAVDNIGSIGEIVSNIESFTKKGIFEVSGKNKKTYEYLVQSDEKYRIDDYEDAYIYYESSDGTKYKVDISINRDFDIANTNTYELKNTSWALLNKVESSLMNGRKIQVRCRLFDKNEKQECIKAINKLVKEKVSEVGHIENDPEMMEDGFTMTIAPGREGSDNSPIIFKRNTEIKPLNDLNVKIDTLRINESYDLGFLNKYGESIKRMIIPEGTPCYQMNNITISHCPNIEEFIIGKDSDFVFEDGVLYSKAGNHKRIDYITKGVKELHIDSDIEDIAYWHGLENVSIDKSNRFLVAQDNMVMNYDRDSLYFVFSNSEEVIIPEGVKNIHSSAFEYCLCLKKIEFPESYDWNGWYAPPTGPTFIVNEGMENAEIVIKGDRASYENNIVFQKGNWISEIAMYLGDNELCVIPDNITSTVFFHNAFYNVKNFKVSENNPGLASVDGVILNKEKDTLLYYPPAREIFQIPASVKKIGSSSLSECNKLTEVIIPETVTTIQNSAFSFCESLKTVKAMNPIAYFKDSAFIGCDMIDGNSKSSTFDVEAFIKSINDEIASIQSYATDNIEKETSVNEVIADNGQEKGQLSKEIIFYPDDYKKYMDKMAGEIPEIDQEVFINEMVENSDRWGIFFLYFFAHNGQLMKAAKTELTEKEKENLSDLARRGTFIEALRIPITDYFAAISFSQIGIEEVSQAILTLIIEAFTEEEKIKKSRDYVLYLIACNPEFRKEILKVYNGFTNMASGYGAEVEPITDAEIERFLAIGYKVVEVDDSGEAVEITINTKIDEDENVNQGIRLKKINKTSKSSHVSNAYSGSFAIESVPDNRKKLINGDKKEEYAVRFAPTSAYLKDGEVFNAAFIHYCRKYDPDFLKKVDIISSAAERYIGVFEEDEQTDIRYGYLKTTLAIHALKSFIWTAVETQPANKRKSFPENLSEEMLAEMAAFIRDRGFANYATMKKTVSRYGALLLPTEEVRREYSLFNPLIRSLNNLNDWKLINKDDYGVITRAGSADLSQLAILITELIGPMDTLYDIVLSDSYDDYTKEAAREILKGWCLFAFAGRQPFFSMLAKEFPAESVKGETINSINYEPEFETIDEGRYTLFKGCVVECNDKRRNAVIPEGVIDFAPVSYNKGYLHYYDSSDTVTYPESYRGEILMTEGVKEIVVNSNCDVLKFHRASLSRYEDFKLETVIINGNIKELGYGLNFMMNLTKLVLPDSLVKISYTYHNNNLKEIVLPEGLKEIGEKALAFCGIKDITIPSSVEKIGEEAFDNYRFKENGITIRAYKGSYGLEWAKKLQREEGNAVNIVELEPIWLVKAIEFSSKISAEYASSVQADDINSRITDIINNTLMNDENYSKGKNHIISNIYSDELDLVKKTVKECETIDELKAKLPSLLAEDIPKVKREKEIKKTKNLITEKKLQISRLEKEISEKEEKIKNYEKEIDENQQILSLKESSLGYDLGNKKFQLTTNLNGQKAVVFKLEEKVKEKEIEIEKTSKELENAGFFKFSLKKELNAKIDSLNSGIAKIKENLESESTKLDEITKDYSELVEKPSAEIESLKSEVSNLVFTKRQISASIDSAKKSIEDYKEEILRLEERLSKM